MELYQDDINVLDVLYLQKVYVVNTLEDRAVLKQTHRDFNIAPPGFIMSSFDSTVIEEVNQLPVFEEVLIFVMNMLMEYGRNFIVGVIQFPFDRLFAFHDLKKSVTRS